jgi:hypothetical protein
MDFGVPTVVLGVAFVDLGIPTVTFPSLLTLLDFVTTAQPFCNCLGCFAPYEAFHTRSRLANRLPGLY